MHMSSNNEHPVMKYFSGFRPFLSLGIFLLVITLMIWGVSTMMPINAEQALAFFLPGFFVCLGYYIAQNAPDSSKS